MKRKRLAIVLLLSSAVCAAQPPKDNWIIYSHHAGKTIYWGGASWAYERKYAKVFSHHPILPELPGSSDYGDRWRRMMLTGEQIADSPYVSIDYRCQNVATGKSDNCPDLRKGGEVPNTPYYQY